MCACRCVSWLRRLRRRWRQPPAAPRWPPLSCAVQEAVLLLCLQRRSFARFPPAGGSAKWGEVGEGAGIVSRKPVLVDHTVHGCPLAVRQVRGLVFEYETRPPPTHPRARAGIPAVTQLQPSGLTTAKMARAIAWEKCAPTETKPAPLCPKHSARYRDLCAARRARYS